MRIEGLTDANKSAIMPKYDASAFIAACDKHGIPADSDLAKALRDVISHDTDKLLAAATSYIDIVRRASGIKADKHAKTGPLNTTEKESQLSKAEELDKPENDSSCGTPEKSDKPKREVNKFSDAELEFAKKLYSATDEWGVTDIPPSASKFATTLKSKAHIKCARSLKFLKPDDLKNCLKEVFPEKEYAENDNAQMGYAIFAWIKSRQPHKQQQMSK